MSAQPAGKMRVRLMDSAEVWREVERHGDAVVVPPMTAQRRCALLVQLFRATVFVTTGNGMLVEACAGMIVHEDAETATRREAFEKLGVALTTLEYVARIWPSPGVSTERQTLFLAPYCNTDRIADGKLLTLILALRLRRLDLFADSVRADSSK